MNFLHFEHYVLDEIPEKLVPIPAVIEWGLPSEPWVFVSDRRGLVVAKYKGSISPEEFTDELLRLDK